MAGDMIPQSDGTGMSIECGPTETWVAVLPHATCRALSGEGSSSLLHSPRPRFVLLYTVPLAP